jgi:hypothetical protein
VNYDELNDKEVALRAVGSVSFWNCRHSDFVGARFP